MLEEYEMTILDFLINLGKERFSNEDLINFIEQFEMELKKSPNLINLEFRIKSADTIESLCERNDYSIFKKFVDLDKFDKVEYPERLIEKINFFKCFNIALKNNNAKIAEFLLKMLSWYFFRFDGFNLGNQLGLNKEFLVKN